MATRRVTAKSYEEQKANQQNGNFPKLSEILVNTSVKNLPVGQTKEVVLRLIGDPISFREYSDKKWIPNPNRDPNLRGKSEKIPFPDAHLTRALARIGHDDPEQCPWRKLGYIGTTKYAQNCLEQVDGVWVPKILSKGENVFGALMAWQQGRLKEKADDPEDDSLVTHLGGLEAPCVRITVLKKGERNTDVEYTITTKSKNMKLTDEMIESLRAAGEPSPEDLAKEREEYNRAREDDDTMPEWQDFFAYGYDLMKIFKHTPIREEKPAEAAPEETTSSSQLDMSAAENDDDVPEAVETTSKAKAAPKAKAETKAEAKTEAKEAKVETETEAEEANPFADDETDADLDWAN